MIYPPKVIPECSQEADEILIENKLLDCKKSSCCLLNECQYLVYLFALLNQLRESMYIYNNFPKTLMNQKKRSKNKTKICLYKKTEEIMNG